MLREIVQTCRDRLRRMGALRATKPLPVRAYGKLELSREYLRVGCEDTPAAREFCAWIDEGFKLAQADTGNGRLRIADGRVLFSACGGREWVVARLWESADKPSEQGQQRSFPFAFFVIMPRPAGSSPVSQAAHLCRQTWERLDDLHSRVAALQERSDFSRIVRLSEVEPLSDSNVARFAAIHSPEQVSLRDWLEATLNPGGTPSALGADLLANLAAFRRSHGQLPHAWRFPVSPRLECETQLEAWLQWVEANLPSRLPAVNVLIRGSVREPVDEVTVLLRNPLPDDFLGLTRTADGQSAHLDRQFRSAVLGRREARPDDSGAAGDMFQQWAEQGASLGDFAKLRLPDSIP